MAKPIKITETAAKSMIENFSAWLRGLRSIPDKISYEPVPAKVDAKANLFFTEIAWAKMQYLIAVYDTEAAWHGIVKRVEPNKSDFVVTDILVYPQEVSGATVNTDQAKYQEWLYGLDDDVFNNLKFQGHSHVNMGVTPSSVDLEHQNAIVQQLDDDMFYVFVIFNKSGAKTVKIYDMAQNTMFDTADVTVKVVQDDSGFLKLMEDAKNMITKKTYSSFGSYGGTSYGGTYGGGYSGTKTNTPTPKAASSAKPIKKAQRADGVESGYLYNGTSWEYADY